jgi:hypothetical protein
LKRASTMHSRIRLSGLTLVALCPYMLSSQRVAAHAWRRHVKDAGSSILCTAVRQHAEWYNHFGDLRVKEVLCPRD